MTDIRITPSRARPLFYITLVGAVLCSVLGVALLSGKFLTTAALLFGAAGTICSAVRTYYATAMELFRDPDMFPSGPPSSIVREMSSFEGEHGTWRYRIAQAALSDNAPTVLYLLTILIGLPAVWV